MKRWILCCTFAAGFISLVGCAQGGGANLAEGGVERTVAPDKCEKGVSLPEEENSTGLQPVDPFEAQGKVVLATANHSSRIEAHSPGTTLIRAGTELTVVLKEKCQGGAISQSVRSLEPSSTGEPTPSGVRSYRWFLPQDFDTSGLTAEANADQCVVGIADAQEHKPAIDGAPDRTRSSENVLEADSSPLALSNDPRVAEQGHLKMLEEENAFSAIQAASAKSRPVVIAVIDTGIDMNHEDLKDVLWRNPGEIPGNGIDDDHNGFVDDVNGYNFATHSGSPQYIVSGGLYHHGTHVAGLAAAQANNGKGGAGVIGSGAQIMALNVFGASSGASTADIANAIRYAADNGADVINLSLGGSGRNAAYESALNYAAKKGVTIVAAAGNERSAIDGQRFFSPAGYAYTLPGMMAVASVDSSTLGLSTYSNWSPTQVEIGAPGSENSAAGRGLLSTMPKNSYTRIQGTSMASPVAAGGAAVAIAMMRARGYTPTAATVKSIMINSAKMVPALATKIRGGKVLNLRTMAEYIDKNFSPGGHGAPAPAPASPNVHGNNCATTSEM